MRDSNKGTGGASGTPPNGLAKACSVALGIVIWLACANWAAAQEQVPDDAATAGIQHIDLVHFAHTDFGFTDHPLVCRELQRRYLDVALDAISATSARPPRERFCWTAEGTVAVDDWWQAASAERREEFLRAVQAGQLEISALAFNQTPTLNRQEWQTMLHWLSETLWQRVQPNSALQNDVNGIPRAGAIALLDRGIRYLFMGINSDSGGPPKPRPSAFWWKMPDGRKIFVWLGEPYSAGYYFFNAEGWRRGPVPAATDTRYRPPRPNEILGADEATVRKAHECLLKRIRTLQAQGYRYPTLLISMTNEWRIDNDPPFPPLAEFVAEWNRLGLKPTLRLTTMSAAMQRMEEQIGRDAPVYEGEWTDWWANGAASGPRELSASRWAKRLAAAAELPLWGPLDQNAQDALRGVYRDLCLFDEHTWGHANCVTAPYDLEVLGQYNEKSQFAYRPLALAQLLLSQRVRTRVVDEGEGLFVANPASSPWSGWINLATSCLRDDYKYVEDPSTGVLSPLEVRNGLRPFSPPASPQELTPENPSATFPDNAPGQTVRFWVENLEGGELRRLQLSSKPAPAVDQPAITRPDITTDENGWPTGASWSGTSKPLFLPGLGDVTIVRLRGFAPRWVARDIWETKDAAGREKKRQELLDVSLATASGKTTVEENAHTTVFIQRLRHARCRWLVRELELWNAQPRARLTVRFDRLSSLDPEVFFVTFPLPCGGVLPRVSNGGVSFVPYRDQIPGCCRDYFAIDGWVQYETPEGHWLWVSHDAPLVTFGEHNVLAKRTEGIPTDTHRILAMVFHNLWYTNFVGDSHGVMAFRFDLSWQKSIKDAAAAESLAESLTMEPQVVINPRFPESAIYMNRLYHP